MRDLISKGLLTAAAATSVLSLSGGYALAADSDGVAAESPGLLSGNNIQAPLEIPVNICGNTVDPVGVLNPSFGNSCANSSETKEDSGHQDSDGGNSDTSTRPTRPGADDDRTPPYGAYAQESDHSHTSHLTHASYEDYGTDTGSSTHADATATGSPGLLSGNTLQAPVDIPLNVCGNSADVIAALNPTFGNDCSTGPKAVPVHDIPETRNPEHWNPEHWTHEHRTHEHRTHEHRTPEHRTPEHQTHEHQTHEHQTHEHQTHEHQTHEHRTPEHRTPETCTPEPPTPGDHHAPPTAVPETPHTPEPLIPFTPPHTGTDPHGPRLAETGADLNLLAGAAMSAALLLGGGILYRRSTGAARV